MRILRILAGLILVSGAALLIHERLPTTEVLTPLPTLPEPSMAASEEVILFQKQIDLLNGEVFRLRARVQHLESEVSALRVDLSRPVAVELPPISLERDQVIYVPVPAPENKNRVYLMAGYGVKGVKLATDGNSVWGEPRKAFVGGIGYQRKIYKEWSAGVGVTGAETYFFTAGFDF